VEQDHCTGLVVAADELGRPVVIRALDRLTASGPKSTHSL
jgi:hypothetical protein